MNKKIGFIGCGHMAGAIIKGIIDSGLVPPENITASALNKEKLEKTANNLKIRTSASNFEAAKEADIIFLAVKPNIYENVIAEIKSLFLAGRGEDKLVVSMAPGKTLNYLEGLFGGKIKLLRIMPNTPAMLGEAMTAVCGNEYLTENEYNTLIMLLKAFGRVQEIPERLFDAATGVAGSSPAFVFMFIEALADGAVLKGMPRDIAYTMAAQAVLGSAEMVLKSGLHPAQLKDMVCSPGGTTIEGVTALEDKGLRAAVINAVRAVCDKSANII